MSVIRTVLLSSLLVAAGAGSAVAEDCFPKVRAAAVPHAAPHKAAPPHRKQVLLAATHHPAHRRHIIRKTLAKTAPRPAVKPAGPHAFAESSLAQQTIPVVVPRPVSCDKAPPLVLASAPPVREKPPAQVLLDELAGPSGTPPASPPADVPEGVPGGVTFPSDVLFPGTPGGVPPGGGRPPFTPPGVTPPDQPPFTPPGVTPPDQPPFVPPDQPPGPPPFVPPIIPPDQPPIVPPGGPQPPDKPPGAIPEPSTWGMMILGFFGLGAVLRARRTARVRLS